MRKAIFTFISNQAEVDDEGNFRIIGATIGEWNRNGLMILPNAIQDGSIAMVSPWGHSAVAQPPFLLPSGGDSAPVGIARKSEETIDGKMRVVYTGKIERDLRNGAELITRMQRWGEYLHYSLSYDRLSWQVTEDTFEMMHDGAMEKQYGLQISSATCFEVSPVLNPADLTARALPISNTDESMLNLGLAASVNSVVSAELRRRNKPTDEATEAEKAFWDEFIQGANNAQ